MKRGEGRGATGVVLTIAFWLVAITLILETGAGCSPAPSAATPSSNPPISTSLKAGDNVTLDQGGGATMVAVAATTANLDEWTKSTIANDTLGRKQMLSDGRVFAVDKGTSALIIDIGSIGTVQVRIYSGDYYGESGWIPVEYGKKLPAGTVPIQDMPAKEVPNWTLQVTGTKGLKFTGSITIIEAEGTRLETRTSKDAEGTVPATYYVSGSNVSVFIIKMAIDGTLKLTAVKDGKVFKQCETSEDNAVVSLELPGSP